MISGLGAAESRSAVPLSPAVPLSCTSGLGHTNMRDALSGAVHRGDPAESGWMTTSQSGRCCDSSAGIELARHDAR
jgi:GMP synthase-like glutamine amidotransferase